MEEDDAKGAAGGSPKQADAGSSPDAPMDVEKHADKDEPVEETAAAPEDKDNDKQDRDTKENDRDNALDADDGQPGQKRQKTENDGDAKVTKKLCRCLLVSGFKRPISEGDVRAMLEEHGKVVAMWMSDIKDEALVFYSESQAATAARTSVNGSEWPANSGAKLRASYRNIHAAIRSVRRSIPDFTVELTDADPADMRDERNDKKAKDKLPNPFRQTTTEPVIYWKTNRAYPPPSETA